MNPTGQAMVGGSRTLCSQRRHPSRLVWTKGMLYIPPSLTGMPLHPTDKIHLRSSLNDSVFSNSATRRIPSCRERLGNRQ